MDIANNVIKAMNGNQEAISELYYATYPKLRAVAVSILKNEDDANDIVQDSYIKAFSSLHQLNNAKKFEPWLCRIVSNKCKDYLKKNRPILFSSQNYEETEEPIEFSIEDESNEYNPEKALLSEDTKKQIMDLLTSLPDDQRICLVYHVVQEMKISEIAELLEVSENTVKSRINYAKNKMKAKINELEKKGIKLRGFALFPFIRYLFASQYSSIPPISPEIVASSIAGAAKTSAVISKTAVSSSTIIGETTKTVIGHTIKHFGLKITAGIVAGIATISSAAIVITNIAPGDSVPLNNIPPISTESNENISDLSDAISTPTATPNEHEPIDITDNLSPQDLADLNRYLSYFSEQGTFRQYPCDDESLYTFAYIYNRIHSNNVFMGHGIVFEYAFCINKDIIDNTIKEFFNTQIDVVSKDDVKLKDGVYHNVAADGETYFYLSIARQLYKESDDTYRVIFDVYEVLDYDYDVVPPFYYALDSASANMNSKLHRIRGGVAIIKKSTDNKYYIEEYKESDDIQSSANFSKDTKIIPNGCAYVIYETNEVLTEGMPFPLYANPGDRFIDNVEGYEYAFKSSLSVDRILTKTDGYITHNFSPDNAVEGWSVSVLERDKSTYGELRSIILNQPLTNIDRCFYECRQLTTAPKIPDTVISMEFAFERCLSLKEIPSLPPNVINISSAFASCKSIETIDYIPESVIDMSFAFNQCIKLKTMCKIPKSVKDLSYTFTLCTSLEGEIIIDASPQKYQGCFRSTEKAIIIAGDCSNAAELMNSSQNGNISIKK